MEHPPTSATNSANPISPRTASQSMPYSARKLMRMYAASSTGSHSGSSWGLSPLRSSPHTSHTAASMSLPRSAGS